MKTELAALTVTILVVSACGSGVQSRVATPDEFRPYFEAFDQAAANHGSEVRATDLIAISFQAAGNNEVEGSCNKTTYSRNITIDPTVWSGMDEASKQALILHELGHCILNRDHNDHEAMGFDVGAPAEDLIKVSIMNSKPPTGTNFSDLKDYYLGELFRP